MGFRPSSLAALAAALLLPAGAAQALTLQQDQNISVSGSNAQTLTWNRFDTMGGTRVLTGITFRANGKLGGSFRVRNFDTGASATVRDSQAQLRVIFQNTAGSPGTFSSAVFTPISTSPSSGSVGTAVAADSTQIFSVSGGQNLSLPNQNLFAFESFFKGTGTFTTNVSNLFAATVDGSDFSLNSTLLTLTGSTSEAQGATLIYEYNDMTPAVPGPLALAGAGAAFGWSRRLRRRVRVRQGASR